MSAHTPFPWTRDEREAGTWLVGPNGRNAVLVLRTDTAEGSATLALVESLPMALEALRLIEGRAFQLDSNDAHGREIQRRVAAAIAKAEGR